MIKKTFLIGVDPGRQTGVCVYRLRDGRIHELHTYHFWDAIAFIKNFRMYMGGLMDADELYEVVLEDPQLNKPVFFPKDRPMTTGAKLRKAQDVGRNKENAFLITQFCELNKIPIRIIRPTTKKWNAREFIQMTRFMKETNQHERDSAKLVVGL